MDDILAGQQIFMTPWRFTQTANRWNTQWQQLG